MEGGSALEGLEQEERLKVSKMRWTVLVRIQDKFEEGALWTIESLKLPATLYYTEFAIVSCGPVA